MQRLEAGKTIADRHEINFRIIGREIEHIDLILELGLATSVAGAIRYALADAARRLRATPLT